MLLHLAVHWLFVLWIFDFWNLILETELSCYFFSCAGALVHSFLLLRLLFVYKLPFHEQTNTSSM